MKHKTSKPNRAYVSLLVWLYSELEPELLSELELLELPHHPSHCPSTSSARMTARRTKTSVQSFMLLRAAKTWFEANQLNLVKWKLNDPLLWVKTEEVTKMIRLHKNRMLCYLCLSGYSFETLLQCFSEGIWKELNTERPPNAYGFMPVTKPLM